MRLQVQEVRGRLPVQDMRAQSLRRPQERLFPGARMSIRRGIPTALSGMRLGIAPGIFLLTAGRLGLHADEAAVVLMAVAAVSDVADGWLARRWDAVTPFGAKLDLWADRACVVAVIAGFTFGKIIPWWAVAVLCMAAIVPRTAFGSWMRIAIWFLMAAFPLLLLGSHPGAWEYTCWLIGWACLIYGSVIYWASVLGSAWRS